MADKTPKKGPSAPKAVPTATQAEQPTPAPSKPKMLDPTKTAAVRPTMQMADGTTPESFIVFNPRGGHHFVSDIKMMFGPFEAKDLSWEDPRYINSSVDLRQAIRMDFLQRITPEEHELLLKRQVDRDRRAVLMAEQRRQRRLRRVKAEGHEFEAEEVGAADGLIDTETELSTAGQANDPATYVVAYKIAAAEVSANGGFLDAEEFDKMVKSNPYIIKQLVSKARHQEFGNAGIQFASSQSGDASRGRAFVTSTPNNFGETSILGLTMGNFSRDQYVGGMEEFGGHVKGGGYRPDDLMIDLPPAEEIDLTIEDNEDDLFF